MKADIADYAERCVRDICRVRAGSEYIDLDCRRLGSRKVNEERDQNTTETNQKFAPRPMMVSFREDKDKAKVMTNLYRLGNNDNANSIFGATPLVLRPLEPVRPKPVVIPEKVPAQAAHLLHCLMIWMFY